MIIVAFVSVSLTIICAVSRVHHVLAAMYYRQSNDDSDWYLLI